MAQELELIVELLREMKRANSTNSESFDRLLASINNKLEVMDRNVASTDLIKAYLGELAKTIDEKYSTTLNKFSDIEKALKAMFKEQDGHVKNKDIKELFDIFSTNMNNFYSEGRQQKAILSGIETRLADISSDKSDKEDILRTITLLRNDFENLNHSYKNTIDNINSDLKSILSNLIKSDQSLINAHINDQVEVIYKATNDIVSYLNSIDKRDANLEKILSNVATNESLKLTQGVIDSLIKKSEEISEKITTLSDKTDIEGLQIAASIMNKKLDETVTKDLFAKISGTTEELVNQTDEVKQTLAHVTKNIETLPDTKMLESSLQNLFNKLESLAQDINNANVKDNVYEVDAKLSTLIEELSTIKNIISDLNEVVTSKVITAINDISFENESYDIKNHVSKMLLELPQKEDIDRILENNELNKNAVEDLAKKADILADRLDNLPTHDDMATLNSNQLSLVENLQEVANKDDIESLSAKADEISDMIDKLNFDDEFENLYDKTSSLEDWLTKSKIKENTEDVLAQMPNKAEQKDILEILKTTENITTALEELSNNIDAKKVNRTVSEVYGMIEELKNDFINTTEMHNDSVIVNLAELQKSVTNIITAEDFNNFTEDLKTFVTNTVNDANNASKNIEEIKSYQNSIIDKINNLNITDLEDLIIKNSETIKNYHETLVEKIDQINTDKIKDIISENNNEIKEFQKSVIEKIDNIDSSEIKNLVDEKITKTEDKLVTITEYLNNVLKVDTEEVKKHIAEIREVLENKKSNFDELEKNNNETISSIETYLKEIKVILDTSDNGISDEIKSKLSEMEDELLRFKSDNENALTQIISKIDEYRTITEAKDVNSSSDLNSSMAEITEIKDQIKALGETFNALNYEKDTAEDNISTFVSEKLSELSQNLDILTSNVENQLQQGFAYNAELIEEKTAVLLDFIKELRHSNTENIDLYERLTVTDSKLMDFKQELELINTDVISNLNSKTDKLIEELKPIKEMIASLSVQTYIPAADEESNSKGAAAQSERVKKHLEILHDSVQDDLSECTKYSKSTYEKLEETYNQIADNLSATENNLRDFILGDIDSVIIKIDNLRADLEDTLNRIAPPDAEHMEEFKNFVNQINSFKEEQKTIITEAAEDIKTSINEKIEARHEELKSMLTVAINNEEIIHAIDDLKRCFKAKIKALKKAQMEAIPEITVSNNDEFAANQYEKAFEDDKNSKVIEEIKEDFNKFSELLKELSDKNPEIEEVLEIIKGKMATISVAKSTEVLPEIIEESEDSVDSDNDREIEVLNSDDEETDIQDTDNDTENEDIGEKEDDSEVSDEYADTEEDEEDDIYYDDEDDETLVGINNFDFIKALDLLKQDIRNLHKDIEKVIPKEDREKAGIKNIPSLGNGNLLFSLNNKIELIAKAVNKDWLEEIKNYIDGSEIHSMLEEINDKINLLTLSDNSEWIMEIKTALDQLNNSETGVLADSNKQIQSMLALISEKIDILAATDDYDLMEEIRETIERLDEGGNSNELLNVINEKIDILASAPDNIDEIEDIKDSLTSIEEKFDIIASTPDNTDELEDIKDSLASIEEKINKISNSDDFDRVKGALNKLEKNILNNKDDVNSEYLDEIKDVLDSIESKIDSVASSETTNNIEDIKYTLLNVDEKVDTVKKLSESDAKITAMLETLNHKIDVMATDDNSSTRKDVEDVKHLILAQMDYIEKLEKNNKTDAVKKCLKELTVEVNNLNTSDNTKQIQKTLKDMKESIMAAVVTIFEQVSFVEESEDIKDFVEEKTDEINQSLVAVTQQLKQITNANEDPDYTYSMQDIESDLAKLRLALNHLQTSEQETQAARLTYILDNLSQIGTSVEDLQNSLTKEEFFDLKAKFERINTDIMSLSAITNQLLVKSGESYNALNNGLEDFGKIITEQLTTKVDKVTALLEKSQASDKVMRQALIYMGEWIDSASENMNKNAEEVVDIKTSIQELKTSIPEQTEILNSIEEKFDEQQERLAFFEKQINKLGNLEDRFEEQQERIDRLEMSLEKILSAVEDIDDSKVTRKIDKIDKQIAKLSTNIEKLASYVD